VYPFERFSEDAKKTLTLAQEEAERSHHSYIGTEHLLLGVLRNQEGVGHKVLDRLGIHTAEVRLRIESVLGRNERIIIQQIVPTSRVKQVIEIAFEEARRMGSQNVGSGHLLMGLVIEGEGIAAHVLEDLGATADRVIAAVEAEMEVPSLGRTKRNPRRGLFRFLGGTGYLARTRPPVLFTSPAETLLGVLKVPHIAKQLSDRGLDVDRLVSQLEDPPEAVVKLRANLLEARDEKRAADLARKLELAEKEWLSKLAP
jgi:ClpA/ClpB-like protein